MATPFQIRKAGGSYAVTWEGPAFDGMRRGGKYAISYTPVDSRAQLLPRGNDLFPRTYRHFYDYHRVVAEAIEFSVISHTDSSIELFGDAVPSRFIHGPMISVTVTPAGAVPPAPDDIAVSVTLWKNARSGTDAHGYDLPPSAVDPDWENANGGWEDQMSSSGDERIFHVNQLAGTGARSDWDEEGVWDFVRLYLKIDLVSVENWPQGGVNVVARLWAHKRMWSKNPYTKEANVFAYPLDEGQWSVTRQGVWSL